MEISVGIDVGGTLTKVAAVTAQGRILAEAEIPTKPGQSPSEFVARVVSRLHLMTSELGCEIAGVGLGLAGDVDSEKGVLRFAPSLSGWKQFNFRQAFSRHLKRPVEVDNDANLGVWGAYVVELKRKPRNVVGLALGTGVGGGIVVDGKLFRGATGSAGEIGHVVVSEGGAPCRCGSKGCLEAYAGSYGIERQARELLEAKPRRPSLLRRMYPDLAKLDCAGLDRAARQGDAVAREVWETAGRHLGVGIASLVLVLNPEVVLILGGVSRAGGLLFDPVRRHLAAQPFRTPFAKASVRVSKRHNWGCIGAALLAWEGVA